MAKKERSAAVAFGGGMALSLGGYLTALLLAALLAVREALPESGLYVWTAAACLMSAAGGGWFCVRHSPLGTLPSGALCGVIFAGILVLTGLSCWGTVTWAGKGGGLLACALGGGVAAGLLGGKRGRRVKRRTKRR